MRIQTNPMRKRILNPNCNGIKKYQEGDRKNMNRKKLAYKAASLAMAACMTVGMTSALTGCDQEK